MSKFYLLLTSPFFIKNNLHKNIEENWFYKIFSLLLYKQTFSAIRIHKILCEILLFFILIIIYQLMFIKALYIEQVLNVDVKYLWNKVDKT